jgi:hypothetical protein
MTRMTLLSLLALTLGCGDKDDSGHDHEADADTDADTDADADADTDADSDLSALMGRTGTGSVDGSYSGTEEFYIIGDDGDGDDLCRVTYTLTAAAERKDCDICEWAYDLQIGDVQVTADSDPGCSIAVGKGVDVSALEGTVVSYGYVPEYYGHAEVLMVNEGDAWFAASFATMTDGIFSYNWEAAYISY